ncbi:hypothetical protein MYX65_11475, partial [Acidobacteria bacterium AH-259-L09]|nr:hypothetical protein [Acidobacteria bacterium AH-259-L09]
MNTPESTMLTQKPPTISLPKNWPSHVKSAVLNVISLARAGLHLSATTVGRMLKEPPCPVAKQAEVSTGRVVTAKGPNHVWHLDLTTVTTVSGLWAPWLPFALPQSWPFCWWVAMVVDHYSHRLISVAVFPKKPDSLGVCKFLGSVDSTPNYLICDKDKVFWCE